MARSKAVLPDKEYTEAEAARGGVFSFIDNPTSAVLVLLVIGWIVRFVIWLGQSAVLWPDSVAYYRFGLNIGTAFDFSVYPIYRTPLYPMFLGLFLAFGEHPQSGRIILIAQEGLGLATVLLVYFTAVRITSLRVAFIAAMLFSLHTLQLYYELVIQTEVLFEFLLWLLLFFAVRLLETGGEGRAFFIGVLAASAALTRPVAQYVPAVILAAFYIVTDSLARTSKIAALLLIPFIVLLFPWMSWNHEHKGYFGLSRDLGLSAFHRIIDSDHLTPPPEQVPEEIRESLVRHADDAGASYFTVWFELLRSGYSEKQADSILLRTAFAALIAHPRKYLLNTAAIWFKYFVAAQNSISLCHLPGHTVLCSGQATVPLPAFLWDSSRLNRMSGRFIAAYFKHCRLPMGVVSGLAGLGLVLNFFFFPDRRGYVIFFLGIILYFSLLTSILGREEDRFRLPIDPLLILYAVDAVPSLLGLRRRNEIVR